MGDLRWYRQDKGHVEAELRAGRRPDLATTTAVGPLDELVALHDEVGAFAALAGLTGTRTREGIDDVLLVRTLAALPFVGNTGFRSVADQLFREPAVLLQLGWSPVQIREGDNGRHRHPAGRQAESLPCHPDTLRDALARVEESAWLAAQQRAAQGLYQRGLVRGGVYAVDGTGLSATQRVVALACVSAARPVVVAWRYLEGAASEKGREAAVTRALVEQVLAAGGAGCIRLLLADGLYADGPLLAWLKYRHGIDALVSLPADRLLYADLQGLVRGRRLAWQEHRYLRTVRGHKERRTVALAGTGHFDSWPGFVAAAAGYGASDARVWACLVWERAPAAPPLEEATALVSTRAWAQPRAAFQAYRARWRIEDDTFRELKEGWGLERRPWGSQAATVRGRVALTILAFNTAQLYRAQAGQRLADKGIRRLRQLHRRELGAAPVVLYLDGCYGVFALEEVLALLGAPARESLRPAPRPPRAAPRAP
ncbi:MAG TPA: transposase [Thermomicrobiales bacterium]|nr:transposase [Thermomicrobiales bacterium]